MTNEEPIEITFDADPLADIAAEIERYVLGEAHEAGVPLEVEALDVLDDAPPQDGEAPPGAEEPVHAAGGGVPGEGGPALPAPSEPGEAGARRRKGRKTGGDGTGDDEGVPEAGEAGEGERHEEEPPPLGKPDPKLLTKMLNLRATENGAQALKEFAAASGSTVTSVLRWAIWKHAGIDVQGDVPGARPEEKDK